MYKMAWKESLRDRWILANRPLSEIRFIYCDVSYWGDDGLSAEGLRQYRKNHRESLRLLVGAELNPGFTTPEQERERVKKQRQRLAPKTGGAALKLTAMQIPEEHLRYHEELQEALNEHGSVSKARFSEYQMGYKDTDGEAQSLDLKSSRFEVKFEHEPLWSPIAPVELKNPLKRQTPKSKELLNRQGEVFVIAPDIQYPFVDERALEVFYQITRAANPNTIVQLGDLLDLTAYSKYIGSELYKDATEDALKQGLGFFATCRQIVPSARIVYLEGNHELRLPKNILANHSANFGLRPADDPQGDPLISVPRMVGLKSVDVEFVPGYPNNRFWINDNFQIIHGATSGKNESKRILNSEKVSTIHGHTHRLNHEIQTINYRDGAKYRHVYGAGSLCRLDTHVPGLHTGYDLRGTPVGEHQENWQHGFLVVTSLDKENFVVEEVVIDTFNGYKALFRGRIYQPADKDRG